MCLSNFSTFISLKPLINFSLKNWSAQNQGNADSSFNPTWYRMNIINDCKEIHEFEHTYKHIKACCCSVTQSCLTLCDPMDTRLPLSFTISQSLLKLMSTELVMPSKHLVLCCPLLLLSIFTSIRVFSNESALWIRWPKYWSFSVSISPSSTHSGLVSFGVDYWIEYGKVLLSDVSPPFYAATSTGKTWAPFLERVSEKKEEGEGEGRKKKERERKEVIHLVLHCMDMVYHLML